MAKHKKAARGTGTHTSSGKTPQSHAQHRRDRQQVGVAKSLALEAEREFPALRAGVLAPEQLVRQAQYVLERAHLVTERHAEAEISKAHLDHIIASMRRFAKALDDVGVKVVGLYRVRQRHYLDVMARWEQQAPGEVHTVGWILSHLRRLFVVIDRPDVIPRRQQNIKLLSQHGIQWGGARAFLIGNTFDWASSGIDVEIIFQAIRDPGKRLAAKLMHYWGMSLPEVSAWEMVDPDRCLFLRVEAINKRRSSRDVEFSCDPAFAAKQRTVLREVRAYCLQQDRLTIRPSDLPPQNYTDRVGQSIGRAFKQCPDQKLRQFTPMKLRDGFFCQVFRDYAEMSLDDARKNSQLAPEQRRRLALAWNEAKHQIGVQGAKAAHAHKGMPTRWSQSLFIARSLRSVSAEFANLGVGAVWVGDVDVSAGKCLFVRLLEGAPATVLMRLQEVIEKAEPVTLRVIRVLGRGDLPEGAAPVMVRSLPV